MKCPLPYAHMITHTDHVLFLKSFSLHIHINTHTSIRTHQRTHHPLFLKHAHMKCPLPCAHMNTHTHIDQVLFFEFLSLHTPINTHTSTHTHQHTPINTHPSTHTHQHTHQPDASGSFELYPLFLKHALMKCPFPYTHTSSHINRQASTHTHQHTPINTHINTHINLMYQGYSGIFLS